LESFAFHAGDAGGLLKGAALDAVAGLELDGAAFAPGAQDDDGLQMTAADAAAVAKFQPDQRLHAVVKLKDGRTVGLNLVVAPPRPSVSLIGKSLQPSPAEQPLKVELKDPDVLPHDGRLTFSIRAEGGFAFTGTETVEVEAGPEASARLTEANGGFVLQNAQIALAMVDLGKAFGPSAFGPLRFRLIGADGASDWQSLGMLVRLPRLQALYCPAGADRSCQLSGSNLFLIQSVANDPSFADATAAPGGFPGNTLQAPAPRKRQLFIRLSDDPAAVGVVTLPPKGEPGTKPGSKRRPALAAQP
jgi:hypothetical protein